MFAILIALVGALWRVAIANLDTKVTYLAGLVAIGTGLLGGHLWMVMFSHQAHHPLESMNVLTGDKSIMGAAIGAGAGAWFTLKLMRRSILVYMNLAVPVGMFAYAIGRLGCLIAGCCYGTPTDLPWGITYPPGSEPFLAQQASGLILPSAQHSLAVHPIPLYHAILGVVLAVLTWKAKVLKDRAVAVVLAGYGTARFGLEFIRGDAVPPILGALNINHIVALVMLLMGIVVWRYRPAIVSISGLRIST